jgi:phage-related holin
MINKLKFIGLTKHITYHVLICICGQQDTIVNGYNTDEQQINTSSIPDYLYCTNCRRKFKLVEVE